MFPSNWWGLKLAELSIHVLIKFILISYVVVDSRKRGDLKCSVAVSSATTVAISPCRIYLLGNGSGCGPHRVPFLLASHNNAWMRQRESGIG